jgi:hypothetical protein
MQHMSPARPCTHSSPPGVQNQVVIIAMTSIKTPVTIRKGTAAMETAANRAPRASTPNFMGSDRRIILYRCQTRRSTR